MKFIKHRLFIFNLSEIQTIKNIWHTEIWIQPKDHQEIKIKDPLGLIWSEIEHFFNCNDFFLDLDMSEINSDHYFNLEQENIMKEKL